MLMHVDGDGDEEHNDENHGGESEDGSHDGFCVRFRTIFG